MPRVRAFCLNEPSDRFINFESLATGVRALECALSSLTSSLVYSLRLLFVFVATLMFSGMIGCRVKVIMRVRQAPGPLLAKIDPTAARRSATGNHR